MRVYHLPSIANNGNKAQLAGNGHYFIKMALFKSCNAGVGQRMDSRRGDELKCRLNG